MPCAAPRRPGNAGSDPRSRDSRPRVCLLTCLQADGERRAVPRPRAASGKPGAVRRGTRCFKAGSTRSNDGHMKLSHPSITAHAAQERAEDQARLADQRRAEAEEARVTAEHASEAAQQQAHRAREDAARQHDALVEARAQWTVTERTLTEA